MLFLLAVGLSLFFRFSWLNTAERLGGLLIALVTRVQLRQEAVRDRKMGEVAAERREGKVEQVRVRLAKLKILQRNGVDAYPVGSPPSHSIAGRSGAGAGQSVAPASDSSSVRRLPTRRMISAIEMQSSSINPPMRRKLALTPKWSAIVPMTGGTTIDGALRGEGELAATHMVAAIQNRQLPVPRQQSPRI